MTKVLVLGSSGMLGHQVCIHLKNNSNFVVSNISYTTKAFDDTILVDARNEIALIDVIYRCKPDFIVNCIGVLIKESCSNPENAIFLNAYLPHLLVRISKRLDAKVIHVSTDCVFSGKKTSPYIESDEKDGVGMYATTKALGEPCAESCFIIRTSIVGPEIRNSGCGLFHWFMGQSGTINGFTKVIWSGVTTIELARFINWSIENNMTGIYHLTNNQPISKYDLLCLFKEYTQKNIEIIPDERMISDKSFIDTNRGVNYIIPSYDNMISDMVRFIKLNVSYYPYYFL